MVNVHQERPHVGFDGWKIENYLLGSSQHVQVKVITYSYLSVTEGLHQGPLLFILYINNL